MYLEGKDKRWWSNLWVDYSIHIFICILVPKNLNLSQAHNRFTLKRISAAISITISVLSLTVGFLYIGNNDINRYAIAQQIINESFVNNTETVGELDKILGNNTAIILSDEYISNPNNTLLDSINTNIQEDCMKVPNTNHLYCP